MNYKNSEHEQVAIVIQEEIGIVERVHELLQRLKRTDPEALTELRQLSAELSQLQQTRSALIKRLFDAPEKVPDQIHQLQRDHRQALKEASEQFRATAGKLSHRRSKLLNEMADANRDRNMLGAYRGQ